jgi:hypothetical protein
MTITYCNNLDELLLKIIPIHRENIDFFYMSIGSKLNEPVVHLKNEKNISNASYQMIPQCLRNPHNEKMKIVIIIDSFSCEKNIKLNKTILMENETSLTNIFMVNYNINSQNVELFGLFIKTCADLYSFLNEKTFMICNFIKFMNEPNLLEKESEKIVDAEIIKILRKTKFEDSYYVWFGYNNKLYNFVFNKKQFGNIMNYYPNIKKLESYIQTNNYDEEYLKLAKIVYDLTDFDNAYVSGAPSLYDRMFI